MMTADEIRLKQNPVLTNLLLGMGQGTMVAERLFPRLPQALSKVVIAQVGEERFRQYNLRRAPGSATKRVSIKYDGKTYEVNQYSVEIPMPRELIRESEESRRLNLTANLDISHIAMSRWTTRSRWRRWRRLPAPTLAETCWRCPAPPSGATPTARR